MTRPCQLCGVDMTVWGRLHICRAKPAEQAPAPEPAPAARKPRMANKPARMANTPTGAYRYRDEAKRKVYMRDLMRLKRAKGKKAKSKAIATTRRPPAGDLP